MSEEAQEEVNGLGAGIVGEPQTEAPPTPEATEQPPQEGGQEDAYKQFLSTLPDEMKTNPALLQTKDFTSLADQFINAQRAIGRKRLEQPQEDWTDENWNDFFGQLRPENDEYLIPDEVKLPAEFPEGTQVPEFADETIQELVDFAGEMGLTQRQFDQLYARWAQMSVEGTQLTEQDSKQQLNNYRVALETEWGDSFDKNIQNSRESFAAVSQEIPELNELMQDPALANHPGVLKLFNKLGGMMGDTLPAGGSNIPGSFNNTVQGIQSQIQEIDMDYSDLILSNPSQLKVGDRQKREQILQKRAQLYAQLYPTKT